MARIAVLDPDDDPQDAARFEPSAAARAMLLAELTGRRLEIRRQGGDLVARLTPAPARLRRVLAWMRRTIGQRRF
jgi:hypothetical protein